MRRTVGKVWKFGVRGAAATPSFGILNATDSTHAVAGVDDNAQGGVRRDVARPGTTFTGSFGMNYRTLTDSASDPEPTAIALATPAFGGLGFARLRRKRDV